MTRSFRHLQLATTFFLVAFGAGCESNQFDGLVAGATPEAADAGARILAAGGNAVDAAVAVSFALAVTEPAMSGLGGQTQILIAAPGADPVIVNGTSYAPSNTPANVSEGDLVRHRATTIPSSVSTLDYAWRTHGSGSVSWADLLAPAISYANDGFVVGRFRHRVWRRLAPELARDSTVARLFLSEDGMPPAEGSTFEQPVLARTLSRIAEYGAADFYHGEIARAIAADMEGHGGWLAFDDLDRLAEPTELAPVHGTYREFDIYTMTPPGGGWVVLQILNILELYSEQELAPHSATRLAHIANALRIGHRERRDRPVEDLVDYGDEVATKTAKRTARELAERGRGRGETTHFAVVDKNGMIVSATASINNFFGSKAASAELGFLYNDYMNEFVLDDPNHPFALETGAMPYSSMTPTVLVQDGVPVLGLGSPGSARIVSAIAQVIQLWVDADLSIDAAVAFGRIHVVPDSLLYVESATGVSDPVALFGDVGFVFGTPGEYLASGDLNAYFGGVHAVALEQGLWRGAADPRRDGAVTYADSRGGRR